MNRNGKIARLPEPILDQLNARLDDGQDGPALLPWLNSLPEVQSALKEHFDGAPLTKQNLSQWRQGGFRQWQLRRDMIDHAGQLFSSSNELRRTLDTACLPGALAAMLAARYAALLNTWDGQPTPAIQSQLRLLRSLNQDIALLQKTLHADHQRRAGLEHQLYEEYRIEREDLKKRTLDVLGAPIERDALAAILGGDQWAKDWSHLMIAIKHDMPIPYEKFQPYIDAAKKKKEQQAAHPAAAAQPAQPPPPQSNPVAPSRTESTPVPPPQPDQPSVTPSPTQSDPVALSPTNSTPVPPTDPPPATPTDPQSDPVAPSPTDSTPVAPTDPPSPPANLTEPPAPPSVLPSPLSALPSSTPPTASPYPYRPSPQMIMAKAWERLDNENEASETSTE